MVVLGAGIAAWWLWPTGESAGETPPPQTRQRIKEVTPAPAPKAAEGPREPTEEEKRQAKIKYFEDAFRGREMPQAIKTIVTNLKHPPQGEVVFRVEFPFVNHVAERKLANLMSSPPGTFVLRRPDFGADFDQDFMNALVDKLVPEPGDSEEVKEVKAGIEAAKKELAELCRKEGKKPSEIMNEFANSLYDLGQFQRNIEKELDGIYADNQISDDEVKDFCAAANKMLEEKGLDPIPYPDLTARSLELTHEVKEMNEKEQTR